MLAFFHTYCFVSNKIVMHLEAANDLIHVQKILIFPPLSKIILRPC